MSRALLALAFLVALAPPARTLAQEVSEYELKAVFLYRFSGFVDWPVDDDGGDDPVFSIGVLGDDPFGDAFDVLADRTVNGRPIEIRRFRSASDISRTDILYVSASGAGRLADVLSRLRGEHTLTVGDAADFLDVGGMIRFVTDDRRVQLHINRCAAEGDGLRINARLLQVADQVEDRCEQVSR